MNDSLVALGRLIADWPDDQGDTEALTTLNAIQKRLELDIRDPLKIATAYTASTQDRDSSKDIDLEPAVWTGGVSDGTTLWFVNGTDNKAVAYEEIAYKANGRDDIVMHSRDTSKDITLGAGSWHGAVSNGTTVWFVNNSAGKAIAYTVSTRARDSSKDIDLGSGNWTGGVSDGTTLWFTDTASAKAIAYTASTRGRDSSKDITLGTEDYNGGFSDNTTLWFVNDTTNMAVAYVASTRAKDTAKDINLADGSWTGGVTDGETIWLVDSQADIEKHGAPLGEKQKVLLSEGYEMLGSLYIQAIMIKPPDKDTPLTLKQETDIRRLNRNRMRLKQAIFNLLDPEEEDMEALIVEHFTSAGRDLLLEKT